jgi:hypothetical protein
VVSRSERAVNTYAALISPHSTVALYSQSCSLHTAASSRSAFNGRYASHSGRPTASEPAVESLWWIKNLPNALTFASEHLCKTASLAAGQLLI